MIIKYLTNLYFIIFIFLNSQVTSKDVKDWRKDIKVIKNYEN